MLCIYAEFSIRRIHGSRRLAECSVNLARRGRRPLTGPPVVVVGDRPMLLSTRTPEDCGGSPRGTRRPTGAVGAPSDGARLPRPPPLTPPLGGEDVRGPTGRPVLDVDTIDGNHRGLSPRRFPRLYRAPFAPIPGGTLAKGLGRYNPDYAAPPLSRSRRFTAQGGKRRNTNATRFARRPLAERHRMVSPGVTRSRDSR